MRQSIYLRLGVLAVVLATFFGLAPGSAAQTNTGKTYSFSLTVKSATVKSFTEEFTKKTGILFSYESALARKEMETSASTPGTSLWRPSWMTFSDIRCPDSATR